MLRALLAELIAVLSDLVRLQRAELELRREEHRALRRRGWGPADRMSVREAARWLGVSEARAEVWLARKKLLRVWDVEGGEVRGVVAGELAAATRDGECRPSAAELEPAAGKKERQVRPRRFGNQTG